MKTNVYIITISSILFFNVAIGQDKNINVEQQQVAEKKVTQKEHSGPADWTILIYLQADNNLAPFAEYNINEMQRTHATHNVNVLLEWHLPNKQFSNRYRLTPYGMESHEHTKGSFVQGTKKYNPELSLIHSMQWAVKRYPAKHYMLVFWNHGNGILDQNWYRRNIRRALHRKPIHHFPWLEIPGLELVGPRGILYSETHGSYMNNQQLTNALSVIKETVLGKKIDIIGMDACLMSMVEVAAQIKDYADILVASQNSEPGKGWNYAGILKSLNTKSPTTTPRHLAKTIVKTYERFYKNRILFYTQSALDLSLIDDLQNNINEVVHKIELCRSLSIKKTNIAVKLARSLSVKFDTPSYIDLYSFYQALLKTTSNKKNSDGKYHPPHKKSHFQKAITSLRTTLKHGQKLIEQVVQENVVGKRMQRAKGISIYYPRYNIHDSYIKTKFAQESGWIKFLTESK